MKRLSAGLATALLFALFATTGRARTSAATPVAGAAEQTIVFAGGCFWGIQSVFEHTRGVTSAVSGYAGGRTENPSYEDVSSGATGHAESVRVQFDPAQVSLEQLLQIFFAVAHDPTERDRQGPDVGTQYRSMIMYTTAEQRAAIEAFIAQLSRAKAYDGRQIVTQVVPFKTFYVAEEHHQHYAERNPTSPYIAMFDLPKVANLKKRFPALYRDIR